MRVAVVAAVVLFCWSRTAPLNATEFVALRFSCNYIGNAVELVPSTPDRLHVVVGDREQKIIRTCAPGSADKCRSWAVYRFDLLCGEKKVSWRMLAEQLLNLAPGPAGLGDASVRAPLEPWELRALRAESGFAPVDELGGRIFSSADMPRQLADGVATRLPDAAKFNLPKRDLDSVAAANLTNVQIAARDNPFITKFAMQRWDGEQIGRFLVVLAFTLLLTFMLLTVVHTALLKRKWVFGSRPAPGEELRSAPEAEACHELMKQIASELMRATGAVNSLQDVPALQSALYRELNSIRQSLGLAPQAQDNSAEKKDWYGIKLQLSASLQGTQRIIEIAEAARASFSSHPTALQDVTTPGEAYAFLGLNATSSEMVLRKTVNALRLCWHPDLATDDEDRRLREIRIKQINMAWDLISQKRMSTC